LRLLGEYGGVWIFLGLLAILLVSLVLARFRKTRYPYRRRGPLFSPAEARFFSALERAVDGRARIYAKVRLADLVSVRNGASGRRFWQAFNAIACKHVDYVLCDRQDHEVLCVIELDDRSHQRRDRQERDRFVDAAMRSAGIPIFHFTAQSRYRIAELKTCLNQVLP
jgi:hypothetical protein